MQRAVAHLACYKRHIMQSAPSLLLTCNWRWSLASVLQGMGLTWLEQWLGCPGDGRDCAL